MLENEDIESITEDDIEEFLSENPTKGIFFSVHISYNMEHPTVKRKIKLEESYSESDPLKTYTEAEKCSETIAEKIRRTYRGASVFLFPFDQIEDEYNLYIIDMKKRPIAKLGVVIEDYRRMTIH